MELSGHIITDPKAEPFYGRVVIENGRIISISPLSSKPEPRSPFVAPGFIDAHTHPLELGLEQMYVSLAGAGSIGDVLGLVAERLRSGPESGIMLGFNMEPDALVESRYPTMTELDRITTAVPILLYRVDGHSAVVNTRAFESGLAESALDGCEKDGSGRPTGVLRSRAYEYASRRFKTRLEPSTIRRGLELAAAAAARQGVTTIAALVGSDELDQASWALLVEALSGLDVRAVPFLQTRRLEIARGFGLPRAGGCLLIDGSFGSHTAALDEDYADAAGNRGICYFSDEELLSLLRQAEELGLQTAFHSIGDRATEQLVRCHERLGTSKRLRHRIEHAELLNPSLIDRIARLGLVICVQPAFEALWGGPDKMYARRLGERWKSTNRFRSMLDAGITLAGGSDAPITPIDPLTGIKAAVEHPNPEQRLRPDEALALFTTHAAFSLFLESKVGRLEPGYDADVVLLDKDPRKRTNCRILATYRAGVRIFPDSPSPIPYSLTPDHG